MYRDSNHLSEAYVRKLAPSLAAKLVPLLGTR